MNIIPFNPATLDSEATPIGACVGQAHSLQSRPSGRLRTVIEFCEHNQMGRSTFYKHLKAGKIKAIKIGTRTMVPDSELEAWIYRLDQPYLFPIEEQGPLAS
ncbi:helix-turn-helix transcriptional regulator [Holophaga foetida]|uniref:helix-turn-helix transcriptional regulator n=1 Tax=Holophaga foetida TaxID=35839 RepID=UPI000247374A|nr:helix-turn-helix domain-containing protein [Holophaga foetida]